MTTSKPRGALPKPASAANADAAATRRLLVASAHLRHKPRPLGFSPSNLVNPEHRGLSSMNQTSVCSQRDTGPQSCRPRKMPSQPVLSGVHQGEMWITSTKKPKTLPQQTLLSSENRDLLPMKRPAKTVSAKSTIMTLEISSSGLTREIICVTLLLF